MQKSKIWYLQRINFFKAMTPDEIEELARMTHMKTVKKGEIIYFPGESSNHVYLLKEGHIKIFRFSERGRELTFTAGFVQDLKDCSASCRAYLRGLPAVSPHSSSPSALS